jgi:DNA-binding transcriptional LysR family regulator
VLTELEDAEDIAAGPRTAPRGLLTMTAPVVSGEMVLRPILDAFLDAYPTVSAKLLLFDRAVNLIEEGVDVALRIGPLVDSAMVAMRLGGISRIVVAAPRYLKQHPRITEPGDLAKHQIVAMAHLPNSWTFAPQAGSSAARTVQFTPRLVVNSTYAAVASAVAGRGVARMYSYQVAAEVARGELEIVLADDEDPEMPAHLISPQGRLSVPKVRAFTDFAVPRLKKQFVLLKRSVSAR